MKQYIQQIQNTLSKKGHSKSLTFSMPHVLKAIQLLSKEKFVSRAQFCNELLLGEGAVKTLIQRLKNTNIVKTTRAGTFLTEPGKKLGTFLDEVMPYECNIKKCSILSKKYNHAIILRNSGNLIKTGLEQRDYAILYGSEGCVTLIYKNNKFIFPSDDKEALHN
ncbi:MAG: DUF4443 domain-containing protein, partial [Nitrosopumilaceae archaeon]|nr:DUF4443 domain-containing protein [Nitrosopumilaceae archaeon]